MVQSTWHRRFSKSLSSFAESYRKDKNFYINSLEESFINEDNKRQEDVFDIAWKAISHQYINKALRHMESVLHACESPIEEAMLFALCITCHEYADNVRYKVEGHDFGDLEKGIDSFRIEPQASISNYRVDFLITYGAYVRDSRNKKDFHWKSKQLVVECDGHAFHEKTKEQAQKDKKRDRELQMHGYRIFHYTGTEIWSDVFKCAQEAIKSLQKEVGTPGL